MKPPFPIAGWWGETIGDPRCGDQTGYLAPIVPPLSPGGTQAGARQSATYVVVIRPGISRRLSRPYHRMAHRRGRDNRRPALW